MRSVQSLEPAAPPTYRPTPAWLLGIMAMPYGSFNGVVAVGLPYLLRKQGISVDRIAAIAALVQAPAIWYVLWAPVVDIKFRRRTWIVALSVLSGVATAVALHLMEGGSIRLASGIFVVASVFNQPVSSAVGGLVAAVMPGASRGRAAGATQGGILAAGVAAGGLAVLLSDHSSIAIASTVIGLLIVLPSFAALFVHEPRRAERNRRAHIARMVTEIKTAVRRRNLWLGMLLFLSPCGAGALMNLFSGVAIDYHASANMVVVVVVLAGLLTAAGALVGGTLLDRIDRWRSYPIAGLVTSIVVMIMLFAPVRPATYIAGAAAYAMATGFGYAAFMALALDLVGGEAAAGSTLFTLLTAALNIPVVYMIRLDGLGHARFGVRGMLAADGLANAVSAILLLVVLRIVSPSRDDPAVLRADTSASGAARAARSL
ncbi:MAG TPA: MFS transporter [Gemmatimonadaceae bacterium]